MNKKLLLLGLVLILLVTGCAKVNYTSDLNPEKSNCTSKIIKEDSYTQTSILEKEGWSYPEEFSLKYRRFNSYCPDGKCIDSTSYYEKEIINASTYKILENLECEKDYENCKLIPKKIKVDFTSCLEDQGNVARPICTYEGQIIVNAKVYRKVIAGACE